MADRPDRYVDINVTSGSVLGDGEGLVSSGVLLTCYEYAAEIDRVWLPHGAGSTLRGSAVMIERTARALAWAAQAPQVLAVPPSSRAPLQGQG